MGIEHFNRSRELEAFPVVIGIDEDWEKSICTGSVVVNRDTFYAFYATRRVTSDGKVNEQLSYATSTDGIHFTKAKPNPFYQSAPGYSKRDFRDPKVIVDDKGIFHLFVSSSVADTSRKIHNGALVHMTSKYLTNWTVLEPLITGQRDVPECPDYFKWNSWYYLVYGQGGNTYYLKSKSAYGPWIYPDHQALNEDWVNVAKTAAFKENRRILAGWIPSKKDNQDDGHEIFGGNAVFRELLQDKEGNLETGFVKEMMPKEKEPVPLHYSLSPEVTKISDRSFRLNGEGFTALSFTDVPQNCVIRFEGEVTGHVEEFGALLRSNRDFSDSYKLSISPENHEVSLYNTEIKAVKNIDKRVKVQIIMRGDVIDVNINNQRSVVNRLIQKKGTGLALFAKQGTVSFLNFSITEIE